MSNKLKDTDILKKDKSGFRNINDELDKVEVLVDDVEEHVMDNVKHVAPTERTAWNAKSNLALGTTSATAFRGDQGKTAYDHSQAPHAPSNAQKNSDITKAEIEAKLTGTVTSHTHSLPSASTSASGIVQLNNTVTSTSASLAATANAVKVANDRAVSAENNAKSYADSLPTLKSIGNLPHNQSPPKNSSYRVITSGTGMLYPASYGVGVSMSSSITGGEYTMHLYSVNGKLYTNFTGDSNPITLAGWKEAGSGGSRSSTVVVAASNSSQKSKDGADFIAGATDAQTVINQAINSLPASGGKVLLMEGTYTISGEILISYKSNITLEGVGNSTIIKLRDSHNTNINMINIVEGFYCNVTNLHIHGNSTKQTTGNIAGVRIYFDEPSAEKYNTVSNSLIEYTSNGVYVNECWYTRIVNNIFKFNTYAVNMHYTDYSLISGNRIFGSTLSIGIYFNQSYTNTILDNMIELGSRGIFLNSSGSNSIYGNIIIITNNSQGMYLASNSNYNNIQLNKFSPRHADSKCIEIAGGQGNFVTNNDFHTTMGSKLVDGGTGTITTPGNRL